MSEKKLRMLQDALDQKQKELSLIMSIDAIRDTTSDPAETLTAIVNLLADQLEADLCLLFLLDHETGEVGLKAANDHDQALGYLEQGIISELAERAVQLDHISTWEGQDVLPAEAVANTSKMLHLVGVPIILGSKERLGALVLVRSQVPFGPNELQLLETAEDQIDSAVIQGQIHAKHQLSVKEVSQKEKELSLMTAIDEIRDTMSDPAQMLVSIVNLLAERLEADLCLLFLLDRETGEVGLKAANDHDQALGYLKQVISSDLAEKALRLDHIAAWEGREVLVTDSLTNAREALQLAAVPIIMGTEERLGALILSRSRVPFGPNELQLLETAEDQIDSAVIQGQLHQTHQLTAKELETIYQIDRVRDQSLLLDEMLEDVLQRLRAAIEAEMSFFMRYDQSEKQLEMQAATHQDLFRKSPYYRVIEQVATESLRRAELICRDNLGDEPHAVLCLPLILNEYIIGVLGAANRRRLHSFSGADRRLLRAIGSQIDTALYEGLEKHRLRVLLRRSVGSRVMEQLLANPNVDILRGERKVLTVLYADIRGSTDLAEHTRADLLVGFINDYLSQMTDVILKHEGTLDKFVGDEVMALFGAPVSQTDHALRAVRVGLAMQMAHQEVVMTTWQERGVQARPIGIGIATGELTVGEMGSSQRAEYTVIGRAANLGARICSVAKGGQVLISQDTYDLVKEAVEVVPLPGQHFKGVAENVTIYHVLRVLD